jgi:hypothetical protein
MGAAVVAVAAVVRNMDRALPLGLRENFAAPSGAVERLRQLESYDLSFLNDEDRLVNESHDLIKSGMESTALVELKRFLSFPVLFPGGIHTPSAQVDKAWHVLIFHTRIYRNQICKNILGLDYFDHTPRKSTDPLNDSGFTKSLAQYRAAYGEPPASMWGPVFQAKETKTPTLLWWIIGGLVALVTTDFIQTK